jgi:hypothetical protein
MTTATKISGGRARMTQMTFHRYQDSEGGEKVKDLEEGDCEFFLYTRQADGNIRVKSIPPCFERSRPQCCRDSVLAGAAACEDL